jgi:hypothetical protein
MPRFRIGLAWAAVLALVVLSTGTVAASTGPGTDKAYSQSGSTADAFSGGCASNGDGTTTCWNVGINVFSGKMSDSFSGVVHANQVCVYLDRYVFDDTTGDFVGDPRYESGCKVDLPKGTLQFGRNLTGMSLATTVVTIQQLVCTDKYTCEPGPTRDVTVVGTWTGTGPIMSSKYRGSGDDGTCRYAEAAKGTSRDATFSGTVAGLSLGGDTFASIADGKYSFRSRCTEV